MVSRIVIDKSFLHTLIAYHIRHFYGFGDKYRSHIFWILHSWILIYTFYFKLTNDVYRGFNWRKRKEARNSKRDLKRIIKRNFKEYKVNFERHGIKINGKFYIIYSRNRFLEKRRNLLIFFLSYWCLWCYWNMQAV